VARIIVVDDDQDVSEVTADMLRAAKHQVTVASTIKSAHEIADTQAFDIAIIDMVLPDGDARPLAAYFADLGTSVIATSGYPDIMAESARRGFLAKPFGRAGLIAAVNAALADRSEGPAR
jgi:two-component system OmpR family response regulator